jgi:hypothetical protein
MEGKSVHEARRRQQQLDRKWHVGDNKAAANQVHFDEAEEHEVSADIFEAAVRKVLAARMQGEAGCAGLQVLLAGVEDMDEQEHSLSPLSPLPRLPSCLSRCVRLRDHIVAFDGIARRCLLLPPPL